MVVVRSVSRVADRQFTGRVNPVVTAPVPISRCRPSSARQRGSAKCLSLDRQPNMSLLGVALLAGDGLFIGFGVLGHSLFLQRFADLLRVS
jgi:hypothetical protein